MDRRERLTILRCNDCNRQILQNLAFCPACGGATNQIEVAARANRPAFHSRRKTCQDCQYWGKHRRPSGIATGCGMLAKPCRAELLWLRQSSDWCPMGMKENEPLAGVIDAVRKGDHSGQPPPCP